MKEKKEALEYIDIKQAIDASEKEIEKCKTIIALSEIGLAAFKAELPNYPKPKFDNPCTG